jgi:selenocysteine lyase/cysteine desulfurase
MTVSNARKPRYDLAAVRADLPILEQVNYLNVGTFGIVPEPVMARTLEAIQRFDTAGYVVWDQVLTQIERTRRRVAALIGAKPEEITLTDNATDGVNLVLAGLDWQPSDELLISDQEHPAITFPAYHAQKRGRLRVRQFHVDPDPEVTLRNFSRALRRRTRLVAFSHVSCLTGVRLPAEEICALARAAGVLSLVDAAQSFAQFPINVGELDCDFLSGNGHKWLCAPKGTGFLYARLDRMTNLEPVHLGAGSSPGEDDEYEDLELWPNGRRFEFGTRGHAIYEGFTAAIEYFDELGWEAVEIHTRELADYLKGQLHRAPWATLLTPDEWEYSSGLTTFQVDGVDDVQAFRKWLLEERQTVVRSVPEFRAIRISTAFFNSQEDVDRLMKLLEQT